MLREIITEIENAPEAIKNKTKFIIRERWNMPLDNQGQLVLRHYRLCSYGLGIPHYFFDLAEDIVDSWIGILKAVKSPIIEAGENHIIAALKEEAGTLTEEQAREEYERLNDNPQNMAPLRVFEGFAGYGGASFGLRRSGIPHVVVGMSEFDPFASQLLAQNFPNIHNWGDITQINAEELPDFDLFTGGFPCQPFSSAGMQIGVDDPYGRGTLIYHILRIVQAKHPQYLLLENVKGLTQKKFADTFENIKNILRDLGYGELAYAVLNSKDYGIPQNRERLWMFARLGGLPEGFDIIPPKEPLNRRFGDFLDANPPQELYLSQAQIEHLKEKHHIDSFVVDEPLCFDVYNKKIKRDALCITITQPEHNSLRVVEVPHEDGMEIVRKMSIDEQFRFMGFEDGELNYEGQSYSQMSKRAGNGWDVNLVGKLIRHIFAQL